MKILNLKYCLLDILDIFLGPDATFQEETEGAIIALVMNPRPVFRSNSESFGYMNMEQSNNNSNNNNNMVMMMEKRQLFLRSYQFCRKRSLSEKIRASFTRVKRVMWLRLRSARKIPKLVWSRLRFRWGFNYRRRRFLRLVNNNYYYYFYNHHSHNNSSFL
ncbi:hypothetical protein Ddye_029472 [Dipteronia dyeriana]|uniref:Uncharacterized protein n=1 Tax=Dipteronia dyeriana TaxID=168575 RepID=A0AAD9WLR7_9ROSI|nr:hypothetical protein Ddye_029472 [Dipteronia dyeriana]